MRAGGFGGMDIWFFRKVGGTWQPAQNLGGAVNTSAGESPVWVSVDGNTLVFKSDRSGGYGGMDLYYTTYSGGSWSAPQNLGSAINTSGDETGASLRCNHNGIGGVIYFNSTRSGGQGGRDIWTSTDGEYTEVDPSSIGGVKATFR
jgi:hypothetical protein